MPFNGVKVERVPHSRVCYHRYHRLHHRHMVKIEELSRMGVVWTAYGGAKSNRS